MIQQDLVDRGQLTTICRVQNMALEKCHLCMKMKQLEKSHVWPAFAYRRFVADKANGGSFVDISQERVHNRQYTRRWFCGGPNGCELILSRDEDYAARLCDLIGRNPKSDISYTASLLRFAVSISWRVVKLHYEDDHGRRIETRWAAFEYWKRFLRGSRPGIAPYTQHVFVMSHSGIGFTQVLGGKVLEDEGLVLSQIGPLLFAALLTPDKLSIEDRKVWSKSRIHRVGGTTRPIRSWQIHLGDPDSSNVTRDFAAILKRHELWMVDRAVSRRLRMKED